MRHRRTPTKRAKGARLHVLVIAVILVAGAHAAHAGDRWQWSLTPYIWATDISENLVVGGQAVGGQDTEFKDLVDMLDSSLQLHFEGIGGRWGLFADVMYSDISDSETGEYEIVRFDAEIEETVVETGAVWRPGGRSGRFDLLLGGRLFAVDEDYRLQVGQFEPFERAIDERYVDALIGARYHVPLSERWVISLRGDVSTGGTDLTWTAQGLVGWRFGARRNSAVFLGYRYRDLKYTKADVIEVKRTLSGFGLGVKIGF